MGSTHTRTGKLLCLFFLIILGSKAFSQARILSSSFSSYNVSPENMCNINISSNGSESSAVVEARITNAQGIDLVRVTSIPFPLKSGAFNTSQLGLKIATSSYQNSAMAEYIRLYHQLPSGKYNYCISIKLSDGSSDDLCEDIESESSSFMSLINPMDKDTLETDHPVLIWNHTESFNVLQQGEFYRMMVSEIKEGQTADAAVNVNSPLYQTNFLTRHDVLYPFDAPKLTPGQRYAWQVQKIVNGVITNKTETWEFTFKSRHNPVAQNFVEISTGVNATPYQVNEDKIYFMFREEYYSAQTVLNITITDAKGNSVVVPATNIFNKKSSVLRNIESSRYELNLRELGLKNGFYTMKILNEKNQTFLLNFTYSN